ncbi:MAG TPA: PQQ-dependent sugar dehydrogenase [Gemmatimonadales bacterium]|nr:PQQ-dependent sugar dehydrogenase [Gemmatimonadales bacterium]
MPDLPIITRPGRRLRLVFWGAVLLAAFLYWRGNRGGPAVGEVRLPEGFRLEVWAEGVDDARQMALGSAGTVFVGTRNLGLVYAVSDSGGDGRADRVRIIARGLFRPNGVAFRAGALYVAEVNRILRYDAIESRLDSPPPPAVVYDRFPSESHHGWKYIGFGPDSLLYVPVGAPCNACAPESIFATITRLRLDSTGRADSAGAEVYARGVRNSVGFAWHPDSGELWFSDNGRDLMGDDLPADELNHAPRAGLHFGYPHCHGRDLPDPDFNAGHACADFTPPALELDAHVAPLGLLFYTGTMFPPAYRGQLLVAEHGSWNRTAPQGYRLTLVRFEDGVPAGREVFADGWLRRSRAWGRPVALLQLPDGSVLVSDDGAGAIYRLTWEDPASR